MEKRDMDNPTRKTTNRILEMLDEGLLDRDYLIMACLKYLSEDDVADMARHNEIELYPTEEE
jgi:hypothetical protein